MAEQDRSERLKRRMKLLAITITVLIIVAMLALAAGFSYIFYILGTIDDPFKPRAPDYQYELSVTGLEGFTTENGSAVVMLPLPGFNGSPLRAEGWWVNYYKDSRYRHHGMTSLTPANTSVGPMLAASINMTDYYESYARATPVAIMPGQNESGLPAIVPDRVSKPWSFDDVHVISSGGISQLDYPTGNEGRAEVKRFIDTPLLPIAYVPEMCTLEKNYSTYVYIDPTLRPLRNDSSLRISGVLKVTLNHNKMDASEEGVRRLEIHEYSLEKEIPGGVTGYIPVEVRYSYSVGI